MDENSLDVFEAVYFGEIWPKSGLCQPLEVSFNFAVFLKTISVVN